MCRPSHAEAVLDRSAAGRGGYNMEEASHRQPEEGPVLPSIRIPLLACLCLGVAVPLAAQAGTLSPSPTLPSDTLQANFAPRSQSGPMPELAPSLPSDTLEATEPVDSFPTDPFLDDSLPPGSESRGTFDSEAPQTAADSAALQDIRTWMDQHPGLLAPPPTRALLVRV